jgi:hypothetical protein
MSLFAATDEQFEQSLVYQWCCVETEVQPILPVLLLALFGVVIWNGYVAGGLGSDHNTFIPSYNISFYLASSFWTTLIGMFVMILLWALYSVRILRVVGRAGPDDKCSIRFFQVLSVLIAVGFLLVGFFYSDVSFQNGKLHWNPDGGWRMTFHGVGAAMAFFGLAIFGCVAAFKLHQNVARLGHDRKSGLLFALGILFSCLVFICAILNQIVWNLDQVTDLHPQNPGPHNGTYLTDRFIYTAPPMLAKNSYAQFGIILFALSGMFVNGILVLTRLLIRCTISMCR